MILLVRIYILGNVSGWESWVSFSRTYNRSYLVTVSLLRTMLHFGRKYEMKQLLQEAVYCLETEFPSTLDCWSKQVFGIVIDDVNSNKIPTTSLFEILYMAHEHSVTSILPALYLRICLTHDAVSRVLLFGFHVFELTYKC